MIGRFNFGVQSAYKQLGEIQDRLIGRRVNSLAGSPVKGGGGESPSKLKVKGGAGTPAKAVPSELVPLD